MGFFGGTCVKFEGRIEKKLLRLCCRHHIMEIMLKKVCEQLLGSSQTPNFSFDGSNELKTNWKNIDKSSYRSIETAELENPILAALKDKAIEQITNDAKNKNIRDDYAEINDICLKLLGIRTNKSIHVVGASSKARWLAKALLIGKCYLLRDFINLSDEIEDVLRRICIFISCIYVKFWNMAPCAVDAPVNDLILMQELQLFQSFDNEIAEAAISSFGEHLWYLGEELITLSLFSSKVEITTKNRMRQRINVNVTRRNEASLKFTAVPSTQFANFGLEDFVQSRSYFLFQLFEAPTDFLQHDASLWENIQSYKDMKNLIENTITVTNDGSERLIGVADNSIKNQRARKEINFKNLVLSKFDKKKRK